MSQSIIYPVGKLSGGDCKIESFYTNNNHIKKKSGSKMLCHLLWCGPIPGLFGGLWKEWKLYLCTRMMDDKLNLCPGTEGEWWQRYLSWEWRLGSVEAGCLKAQDFDKFIQRNPLLGPFRCFESLPLAKWPTLLMLPMCKEYPAMLGIPPLLLLVVHSSLTPSEPWLFGVFSNS